MKISSERADLVVVGGGLAGICAAITAARENQLVHLVEKKSLLGGRIGPNQRQSIDQTNLIPQVYHRESGILNEVWPLFFKSNKEGTYLGISRALRDWIETENKIKLFLNTEVEEVKTASGIINAVISRDNQSNERKSFVGKYYLDCTGIGRLAELSGADGEKGVDLNEFGNVGQDIPSKTSKVACLIQIAEGEGNYSFSIPDWVKLKWEENHLSARLNLMESLERSPTGVHLLEWEGPVTAKEVEASELAFCAWDFLKNRSSFRKVFKKLRLVTISDEISTKPVFRANGLHRVSLDDFQCNESVEGAVVLARTLLREDFSMVSRVDENKLLPHPVEIRPQCLISSDFKNLLLAGSSASCSELSSRSLSLPVVAAQMAIASAITIVSAVSQNRLPKTICKDGYIDGLQNKLSRLNQFFSRDEKEDSDNLSTGATASASSTVNGPSDCLSDIEQKIKTADCLIQFPVSSSFLEKLSLEIVGQNHQVFSIKLMEGSGYHHSLPGHCIFVDNVKTGSGFSQLEINLDLPIKNKGWHFLEIQSEEDFVVPLFEGGLVGYILHDKKRGSYLNQNKSITEFYPVITTSPKVSPSPMITLSPAPKDYEASNLVNNYFRPNHLPQLWVSKPTNFKYSEFVDLEWKQPIEISRIEISFDPSYDFIYSGEPKSFEEDNFRSLVREYKIYITKENQTSELIIHQKENSQALAVHSFDSIEIKSLELEILSTHGLNRAQVFQIRTYA
jgi:hypothetical protein